MLFGQNGRESFGHVLHLQDILRDDRKATRDGEESIENLVCNACIFHHEGMKRTNGLDQLYFTFFFLPSIFKTSHISFVYFLFPMIKIPVINKEIILRKAVYPAQDYGDLQGLTGCYLIIPSSKIRLPARNS